MPSTVTTSKKHWRLALEWLLSIISFWICSAVGWLVREDANYIAFKTHLQLVSEHPFWSSFCVFGVLFSIFIVTISNYGKKKRDEHAMLSH